MRILADSSSQTTQTQSFGMRNVIKTKSIRKFFPTFYNANREMLTNNTIPTLTKTANENGVDMKMYACLEKRADSNASPDFKIVLTPHNRFNLNNYFTRSYYKKKGLIGTERSDYLSYGWPKFSPEKIFVEALTTYKENVLANLAARTEKTSAKTTTKTF